MLLQHESGFRFEPFQNGHRYAAGSRPKAWAVDLVILLTALPFAALVHRYYWRSSWVTG